MNEIQKTGIALGAAIILGGVALLTGNPDTPSLDQFSDVGDAFYPDFTDPLVAASLEVIEYDETSGTATPFKVQVKDGVWTIPSHYDYAADGEDRLATTAGGVIDLKKDAVRSNRLQDHEALGVIDPLDETNASLIGVGERITLRDVAGGVLADFIVGKPVEERQGFRYVRLPDKKRTYAVKMDVDISTRFADWIETNLLEVTSTDISRVQVQDYSIDETTGTVNSQGAFNLQKSGTDWSMLDLPPGKSLQTGTVSTMTTALANITITGVRPKPSGLSADLRTDEGINLDGNAQRSLLSKGFFVSRDGRLLSNEGEVTIGTTKGVRYTLRFGEVLIGEGLAVSAGAEDDLNSASTEEAAGGTENRYLFVTAQFDETMLDPKPLAPAPPATPAPIEEAVDPDADAAMPDSQEAGAGDPGQEAEATTADPPATEATPEATVPSAEEAQQAYEEAVEQYNADLAAWETKAAEARAEVARLNDRFAPWYYVISGSDFSSIRVGRDDLLQDAVADDAPAGGE